MVGEAINGIQQEVVTSIFVNEIACAVNRVAAKVGCCSCLKDLTAAADKLKCPEIKWHAGVRSNGQANAEPSDANTDPLGDDEAEDAEDAE